MPISVTVHADASIGTISPNLYGHFAEHLGRCVYGGIWVGPDSDIPNIDGIRRDVVEALREIDPPVIRWPGGCFADDYHWRDGVGPREERPRRVNRHWGKVIEPNHFGTHEFIRFCELVGAEPYIAGNLGSGSPNELRDWVEYLNYEGGSTLARKRATNGRPEPFGVRYVGVGNESWACGGGMRPEYYTDELRRFSTFLPEYGEQPLYKIACGPSRDDFEWTRTVFEMLLGEEGSAWPESYAIDGFGMHYYADNFFDNTAGTATDFTEDQWYALLREALDIEPLIRRHRAIMDEYDPDRAVDLIVDEWGAWHPPMEGTHPRFLYQQNSLRDALVAALTLDVFNRNADVVAMANIAQLVNVLQSMVLTDGPEMVRTPTYYVFEMYAMHQGAVAHPITVEPASVDFQAADQSESVPNVAGSCSQRDEGWTLSLVNLSASTSAPVDISWKGAGPMRCSRWRVLTARDIHAHNSFEAPDEVVPVRQPVEEEKTIELPPASVNVFKFEAAN